MKKHRKLLIAILVFVGVISLASIGVNFWVKYQLPKLLNEKSKTYAISYKTLDIDVFAGNVTATDAVIVPKAAINAPEKSGIYATVKKMEVRNFKILSLLFSDRISAKSLTLSTPEVILYQKNDKAIKREVWQPLEKIISVSDIFIYNGDLKILRLPKSKPLLSIGNINANIDGIKVSDAVLKNKIPFGYEKYSISCDSIFFDAGAFYTLTATKIKASNTGLNIAGFRMVPKYTRLQFVRQLKTEKDLFTISAKSIALEKLDWGYAGEDLFVKAKTMDIDQCHADIYRNKLPADDLTKKYLYNKLLRDLDFELKVDLLKIRNSLVVYEEEKSFDRGSGKLIFNHFYMTATNICSGFKKKKLADLNIRIKCRFMDTSPLDVAWKFNVMDQSDGFNIKGTVWNFDAEKIVPFTQPYMNVSVKGVLDVVHFNFTGNDQRDWGEFAVAYDDLKFVVYQKDDRRKKNKLLTTIGNLFVKNDTKDKVKNTPIALERIPEKSFYNFLWRSIAEGLKKILI